MMNDKFFPELARRLKREGIATGPVEKGCLPVLADGRAAVLVMSHGTVAFNADVERRGIGRAGAGGRLGVQIRHLAAQPGPHRRGKRRIF